jgi:hypothetical protein
MAGEINFGILDPKLGASFATGYNEAEDRRNELAARVQQRALGEQQLQHAMSQNELSKYTLSTAKRSDAQQEALNARVSSPDFNPNNPAHLQDLMRFGPPGQAMLKSIMDRTASEATLAKTRGEITAQDLKAAKDRHDALASGLAPLAAAAQAGKQITHADVYGVAQQLLNQGIISQKDIASIPMQVEKLPQYILGLATSNENSRNAIKMHLSKPEIAGGQIVEMNPLRNVGSRIADVSPVASTAAALEQARAATSQAATSAGRLKVEQDRLAKEGQGVTYIQDAANGYTAVPNRLAPGVAPVPRPVLTAEGVPFKAKLSPFAEKQAAAKVQLQKDLGFAITELSDAIKEGGLIDQSTGSGAGRLADISAGFFGQATPGAIAIGKLQPIADLPLKLVTRFEGPQSNADTKSYKEASAQLADPTLPRDIRKAAGATVVRLMKERQGQFVTNDMAPTVENAAKGNWGTVEVVK